MNFWNNKERIERTDLGADEGKDYRIWEQMKARTIRVNSGEFNLPEKDYVYIR